MLCSQSPAAWTWRSGQPPRPPLEPFLSPMMQQYSPVIIGSYSTTCAIRIALSMDEWGYRLAYMVPGRRSALPPKWYGPSAGPVQVLEVRRDLQI